MEAVAPAGCSVDFALDPSHAMQKIVRAFPAEGSPERERAACLAVRGEGGEPARMRRDAAAAEGAGGARGKIAELAAYAASRASEIRPPAHELGTTEGTNARIGAARLKGQGRSWSRRGAEAICLIGCALATGRPPVAPAESPRFAERQAEAAVPAMGKRGGRMPETSGRGWEPPHRAQPLGKSVMISLSRRS